VEDLIETIEIKRGLTGVKPLLNIPGIEAERDVAGVEIRLQGHELAGEFLEIAVID
jgi:hypothetical protein